MSFLRKNWKYTILATFGFCLLIYAFYTYVVINPAVHLAIAKLAKTYLDEQTKEAETLLNEFWEDAANNLRPKSLEERQQYLAEYRTALESDSEDSEIVETIIEGFINQMNKREVYFE